MKIVGHNTNGCAFFHQLFTVRDILPGCLRLILCQNPRSINAFFLQIPCHSLCFRPRLIASLSSGNNADRVRVFIQIFHSLIQTIFKNRTRTILSHLCAKYDYIVKPPRPSACIWLITQPSTIQNTSSPIQTIIPAKIFIGCGTFSTLPCTRKFQTETPRSRYQSI